MLKDKRVLVTGASGFIASHLTRRLIGMGASVGALVRYNSVIDNVRIADLWDRVTPIEADIRNPDSLRQVRNFAPDVIYHFAAYNHVGDSFMHVSEVMDVNAKGTTNLVQAYDGFERFVYISTSEVYGAQSQVPFVETMTPQPVSPYAVGKYAGELFCRMMMTEVGRPFVLLRPFNAFGPYQSTRAVIAETILTCLAGKPLRATEGRQTREFNYIANLVDGFIAAGEREQAIGQLINIGGGEEISIRELMETIHRETESKSPLEFGALPSRPTEIPRMRADAARAREILGWQPRTPFIEGLRATIRWYRMFQDEFGAAGSGVMKLADFPLGR